MMIKRAGGRWLAAALTASAVLTSGCANAVDTVELPGAYRDDASGGEVRLESGGTFSATDVSADSRSGPADFSGRWEFVDSEFSEPDEPPSLVLTKVTTAPKDA
ncbi:hypothetical protein ACWEIK_00940 [Streptomyces sp. NPDC004673]